MEKNKSRKVRYTRNQDKIKSTNHSILSPTSELTKIKIENTEKKEKKSDDSIASK